MSDYLVHSRLLCLFVLLSVTVFSQVVQEPSSANHPEWSKPYPPFRIAGDLYYVGGEDLASYLITTPKGHILINTGLASSAGSIQKNVRKGFRDAF